MVLRYLDTYLLCRWSLRYTPILEAVQFAQIRYFEACSICLVYVSCHRIMPSHALKFVWYSTLWQSILRVQSWDTLSCFQEFSSFMIFLQLRCVSWSTSNKLFWTGFILFYNYAGASTFLMEDFLFLVLCFPFLLMKKRKDKFLLVQRKKLDFPQWKPSTIVEFLLRTPKQCFQVLWIGIFLTDFHVSYALDTWKALDSIWI